MNIETKQLLAQCIAAKIKTGELYLSFTMTVNVREDNSGTVKFGCYTPDTGHTMDHDEPQPAIDNTLAAAADPEKLLALAAQLEGQARQLRSRVGGSK